MGTLATRIGGLLASMLIRAVGPHAEIYIALSGGGL
jgi:hypothetical protein